MQPVVGRSGLDAGLRRDLTAALLALHTDAEAAAALAPFGLSRFAPVTAADYACEAGWLTAVAVAA